MSIILSFPFATSLLSSTLRCCVRLQCLALVRDFLASSISPPLPFLLLATMWVLESSCQVFAPREACF